MKSVVITGASGGIGQAVVRYYRQAGYAISLAARDASRLMKFASTLEAEGSGGLNACPADVTDRLQVEKLFASHREAFGESPTAVVHLAAVLGPLGSLWKLDPLHWEQTILTNVVGSFYIARAAIQEVVSADQSCSLVFFSGGGAAYSRPYFSAYGCSKTAVLRMVETLSEEFKLQGLEGRLQANAVAPGGVYTAMTEEILKNDVSEAGQRAIEEAKAIAAGQGESPERAAKLCLFLSERARNRGLSGRLIHVNESYEAYAQEASSIQETEKGLLRRVPIA